MCRSAVSFAAALLLSSLAAASAGAGDGPAVAFTAARAGATDQAALPRLARSASKEEIVEDGEAKAPPQRAEESEPAASEDFTERDRAAIMRGRNAPARPALDPTQTFAMPELPMSALLYALLAIGIGLHMLGRLKKKATTETVREWSDAVEMPDKPALEAAPPRVTTPPKAERLPAVQSVQRVRTGRMRGDLPPVPAARGGFGRRG